MRTCLLLPILLLAATVLTACDHDGNDRHGSIANYISIHTDYIAVHAPGRADADITAAGDLSIADHSVAVTTAERELLKHYYATALTLRDHGIATGEAGAPGFDSSRQKIALFRLMPQHSCGFPA